jgi:hypothetical protein
MFDASRIPRQLLGKVRGRFLDEARLERETRERQIPKVELAPRNAQNCQLLLNRAELLKRLKSGGRVAEIGVDHADFSEVILEATQPERLHLVDTWGSERYHDGLFRMISEKFKPRIANEQVRIHRKLSIEAAQDFENDYFDWIYIDTDHSYETTRDELLLYASKVKGDGIIAGHDYTMGNWVSSYRYGVIEAVHEFCVKHDWELLYVTLEPSENQSFAIRRIRAGT